MTLQGMLGDFSVGDVLQLIGQQQKTGILTLSRDNEAEHVAVHFAKGQVVGVESRTRPMRDRIGMLLVRAHAISESQLKTALETHKKTMRRVGDVLLQQGVIDQETLHGFLNLQKRETLYQLFTWQDGKFSFEPTQVVHFPADAMRSESVLLEGFRQLDEWPLIRAKINNPHSCYRVVQPLARVPAKRMSSQIKRVYGLVQPHQDLDTLIGLSRLGQFDTCKALWVMLEAGVIEPIVQDRNTAPKGRLRWPLQQVITACLQWISVSIFVGGVLLLCWQRAHAWHDPVGKAGDKALLQILQR